jgi:branched-chain amino acid transport system permease protein
MERAALTTKERRRKRLDRGIKVRTGGIYAISSWREMAYLLVPRVGLIVGLLCLPLILEPYWLRVICSAGVYALLAMGFDFLAEFVGLVCLGGAFFIGTGGYIAGGLNHYLGLPPVVTLPVATVLGAFVSTAVLLPCLRLRGIYFAIVSFMIPLLVRQIIVALNLFGGTEGISALATFPNALTETYIVLCAGLVSLFALRRLVNEDIGLVFRGIRDNDQAVRASGINVTRFKAQGLFLAALMGCFAGAYISHLYGWLGISLFASDFSILPIAACVMGGGGTLVGPFLGALLLTPLSEVLRDFGQLRVVLYCLILVGFIVYKPEGLMNYLGRKYHQFESWEEV